NTISTTITSTTIIIPPPLPKPAKPSAPPSHYRNQIVVTPYNINAFTSAVSDTTIPAVTISADIRVHHFSKKADDIFVQQRTKRTKPT
ncbi:hypothetical protein C5167_048926, partial [Papaver somniferum]